MKDEVKRILKMVQEGKLSAEDATELIEAFEVSEAPAGGATTSGPAEAGGETPPETPSEKHKDPFKHFVESVEKFGKEATDSVNWQEVARQVREGAKKGTEGLKQSFEDLSKGGKIGFPWSAAQEMKTVSLPLDVPAGKILRIENPCGDVKIVGGHDIGSVTAKATFRTGTPEEAVRRAQEYTLIIEESDQTVLIRQPDVSGLVVNLELQIRKGTPIDIRASSGNISVSATESTARVSGKAGDVSLSDVAGPVEVSITAGHVKVLKCNGGSVTIENKSGGIAVEDIKSNISLRSTSGGVKVLRSAGRTVSVDAVSGDVHVELIEAVSGTVNVHTVSGNADVEIVDGCDCRVSLSSIKGGLECDVEMPDVAKTEKRLTGTLGEGQGTLDVSAVSGRITLKLRDQSGS